MLLHQVKMRIYNKNCEFYSEWGDFIRDEKCCNSAYWKNMGEFGLNGTLSLTNINDILIGNKITN